VIPFSGSQAKAGSFGEIDIASGCIHETGGKEERLETTGVAEKVCIVHHSILKPRKRQQR